MTFYKFEQFLVDRGSYPGSLCVKHASFNTASDIWTSRQIEASEVFTVHGNIKKYLKSRDRAGDDLQCSSFFISDEDKLALVLQAVVL